MSSHGCGPSAGNQDYRLHLDQKLGTDQSGHNDRGAGRWTAGKSLGPHPVEGWVIVQVGQEGG